MSLWREQYVALVMVTAMLLDVVNTADLLNQLKHLSNACKDSKRKRLPQLCFPNSS